MKLPKISFALILITILTAPTLALAQAIDPNLIDETAGTNGANFPAGSGDPSNIPNTMGSLIGLVLSFVGAMFFIFIVVSGIQWMTAGGNEEAVGKAKTRMMNATLGLAITVGAYFITWFISNALLKQVM
ncbi:MAG: hypothetical protein NTZ18_00215 [Candidatus Komeilibacteria bacterium]|nr:hypothetical protein [Candidatus Komeilibacteria bacterium]